MSPWMQGYLCGAAATLTGVILAGVILYHVIDLAGLR